MCHQNQKETLLNKNYFTLYYTKQFQQKISNDYLLFNKPNQLEIYYYKTASFKLLLLFTLIKNLYIFFLSIKKTLSVQ